MKKCPFCGADIEENARFCLYCMTALDEKTVICTKVKNKKRWLILSVALLLCLTVFLVVFLFLKKPQSSSKNAPTSKSSYDKVSSDFASESPQNSTEGEEVSKNENQINESGSESSKEEGSVSKDTDNSSSSVASIGSTSPESSQTTTSSNTDSIDDQKTITYKYRTAVKGDDWDLSYNIPDGAVVIIGVETANKKGEYVIPEEIDGKTVIAIMNDAFCDAEICNTVKKVVVPSTVKTIWKNAFANCYDLSDIYLKGNIHIDLDSLPEINKRNSEIIIHSSPNCNDRNFRLYKSIAKDYGAVWSEWNG